jgi:antitoxin ParD1/3/4
METTTSVALSDDLAAFIRDEVASGRYRSPSAVVSEGLRLLEAEQRRLDALREALVVGENSGPAEPFDFEAFIRGKLADHAA